VIVLGKRAPSLFGKIDRVLTRAAGVIQDRQRGQNTLFDIFESACGCETRTGEAVWRSGHSTRCWRLKKNCWDFTSAGHPLSPLAPLIDKYALHKTNELATLPSRGDDADRWDDCCGSKGNFEEVEQTVRDGDPGGSGGLRVQILCMNENYDKYIDLLVVNKPVLVVGEVNNAEDKPKVFPQEIMALEDAPRKYTRQVHIRLNTSNVVPEDLNAVRDIVASNPGRCRCFSAFCGRRDMPSFWRPMRSTGSALRKPLQTALNERFGGDTYYAKVDMSLPERAQRALGEEERWGWQRRGRVMCDSGVPRDCFEFDALICH